MRVVRTLLLAFAFVLAVVMGGHAVLHVRREEAILRADTERDHAFLAHTLRGAYLDEFAGEGAHAADTLVRAADRAWDGGTIRLLRLDDPALAWAAPTLRSGRDASRVEGALARYAVLVRRADGVLLALEVAEPTTLLRDHLAESVAQNAALTLAALALCIVVVSLLGHSLLGVALSRLRERARRIGEGALDLPPLAMARRDEIGELADEIDAMNLRLREARAALDAEHRARVATLGQLRHADRLRTVGQLASGLAHELGTPLQLVLGRASLLAESDDGDVAAQARVIADQARRMAGLVRTLLDYARRRGPQPQRVDLRALARDVAQLLEPTAGRRGQRVVVTDGAAVHASVDPAQIQQVLSNLVQNALQASPDGAEVRVTLGEEHAREGDGDPVRCCVVRVVDRGQGIAPDDLPRVFDPFFTTKDPGAGTGLGLSVAQGIARDHQGWIAVESAPGEGSTFTVYLPAR